MRAPPKALALAALVTTQGCAGIGALEALGGSCTQEQLVVTWQAAITRGTSLSTTLLVATLTPDNISQTEFNTLRQALTEGGPGTYNVTWTVPAFNVNGGHITFRHGAPLPSGETQQVGTTFTGEGWSAQPATPILPPAVSLTADNFTATSATGSITVLASSPLRLRIDVTTRNAAGETIRLTGDPGFAYQKVTKTCVP